MSKYSNGDYGPCITIIQPLLEQVNYDKASATASLNPLNSKLEPLENIFLIKGNLKFHHPGPVKHFEAG